MKQIWPPVYVCREKRKCIKFPEVLRGFKAKLKSKTMSLPELKIIRGGLSEVDGPLLLWHGADHTLSNMCKKLKWPSGRLCRCFRHNLDVLQLESLIVRENNSLLRPSDFLAIVAVIAAFACCLMLHFIGSHDKTWAFRLWDGWWFVGRKALQMCLVQWGRLNLRWEATSGWRREDSRPTEARRLIKAVWSIFWQKACRRTVAEEWRALWYQHFVIRWHWYGPWRRNGEVIRFWRRF